MTVITEMVHSPVGPSGGERWINCPGSVAATKDIPDVTSEFAAEGIFAHYITELARNENQDAENYLGFTSEDGKITCDKEMVGHVQDFLDYMAQWEGEVFVEQRVSYEPWVENGFGTSDHIVIQPDKKHVVVADFKYGKGIQIFAKGNVQGKLYALGVFNDYGHLYDIDDFTIIVHQPRLDHRDQWHISTDKLLTWADEIVEPAGTRVYDAIAHLETYNEIPDHYFKAGGWCQWCKIKGECKTRAAMVRDSVLLGIDDLDDEIEQGEGRISNPAVMNDVDLSVAVTNIDQIVKWCTDVVAVLKQRVMAGAKIQSGKDDEDKREYWKMVTGRANRIWHDEDKATASLKTKGKLKADQVAPRKIITPAAAEKLLGKEHSALEGLIKKPQGAPTLVVGSDKRQVYKVAADEMKDVDDDTSWLDD